MDPLTLALLGYPLSVLANVTYHQLKALSQKTDVGALKKLFLKAFYKSLDYHHEHYDEYSKKIVDKLRKAVKKNEEKLLFALSRRSDDFDRLLSKARSGDFQGEVAAEIINEYRLDLSESMQITGVLKDCLRYYVFGFFDQMNEKEAMQAILLECLKIDRVLDLLKQMDTRVVTKDDFQELRRIVLQRYYADDAQARKKLNDYDQYIANKFKYLELRGFSPKISGKEVLMELSDIFVPLEMNIEEAITPQVPEQELIPLGQTRRQRRDEDKETKREARGKAEDQILRYKDIVILGDPGSGKSTLLKYLAAKLTHSRGNGGLLAAIVPLYLRISDYADFFEKTKRTLYEYITEHHDRQYQHIYKEAFEHSNLLMLLDGLDEVTNTPLRIRVVEQVMDLMARYPYNRYIVSSRIVGYREAKLAGDFRHFKLAAFGLDEIRQFAEQWYDSIAKNTDNDYERGKVQAGTLYSAISRNRSVTRLATNPLLMTIIAMIHYRGQKLPNKRVELYDICTETFLEHWVQLRIGDEIRLKDKLEIVEILSPIAFEMHQTKSSGLIEEKEFRTAFLRNFKGIHTSLSNEDAQRECREFIDFLREQAGFFYEKGVDDAGSSYYGFLHQTFQEYLAAIELVSRWSEGQLQLGDFVFDARWTELIRLAAAQLRLSYKGRAGRNRTTQFVNDVLAVDDPFPEAHRALQLACLILSDDVSIADELLAEILSSMLDAVSGTDFQELVESCGKLLMQLLDSDYRSVFLNRFEKQLNSATPEHLSNLVYLLTSSSTDSSVNQMLTTFLSKNREREAALRAVYRIPWHGYPFQRSQAHRDTSAAWLLRLKSQNADDELQAGLVQFLRCSTESSWTEWGGAPIIQRLVQIGVQFPHTDIFHDILRHSLGYVLHRIIDKGDRAGLDILLKQYPNHLLVRQMDEALTQIGFKPGESLAGPGWDSFYVGTLNPAEPYIARSKERLTLWFWCSGWILCHSTTAGGVLSYLGSLKPQFSDSDIELIETRINFILGPVHDAEDLNTARFVKACARGTLYDFFGWEGYPFAHITSNPSDLSNIVVRHARKYISLLRVSSQDLRQQFTAGEFDHQDVCSPAKLLVRYFLNQPLDDKLVGESIQYFRTCPQEQKKGAFSILYKVLNPFELA